MSRIRIDRLELQVKGASRHRAREIATALRRELGPALARELGAPRRGASLARVAVDPLTPAAGLPAWRVAREAANRVSTTVARRCDAAPKGRKGVG